MRLTLAFLSCAMPAMAQDFSLDLPVDCTLGSTCYLQNYVDHDPSDAARDFQCGDLTYDTHTGTDFGLPSLAAMDAGVDVLAAAPGTVRGVRNDMRDVIYSDATKDEVAGRDCGNGVVIAHDDGWETQYCHMAEGSVTVRTGQAVEAGTVLGQIGLSGRTQFPHLHITVRRDGQTVDPFVPDGAVSCDGPAPKTLWSTPIPTPPGGLLATGFATSVPDYSDVKAGTAAVQSLNTNDPIVLWAFAFGAQPGDVITLSITGPDGPMFETQDVLERTQALVMRAGGRRAPTEGWAAGSYNGRVTHTRGDVVLGSNTTAISLP